MSEQQQESKFFKGGKSKAIKGLRRYLGKEADNHTDEALAKLLYQHGETAEWGFDFDVVSELVKMEAGEHLTEPEPVVSEEAPSGSEEPVPEPEAAELEPEPEPETPSNVFGNINHTLSNTVPHVEPVPQQAQRAQSRSSYTIERNRPEQHGIKRPSAGGLCRAVWDAMDQLRASKNGEIPTSEQVRALALEKGWNKNNAMLEFYQWRKFNGIVGRTPKAAAQEN